MDSIWFIQYYLCFISFYSFLFHVTCTLLFVFFYYVIIYECIALDCLRLSVISFCTFLCRQFAGFLGSDPKSNMFFVLGSPWKKIGLIVPAEGLIAISVFVRLYSALATILRWMLLCITLYCTVYYFVLRWYDGVQQRQCFFQNWAFRTWGAAIEDLFWGPAMY